MISDGTAKVLGLLQAQDGHGAAVGVPAAAADALGVNGLAVSLVTEGDLTELLWCSDGTARSFEDLQFTLGEGPGPDVVRTGAMVWVPDLAKVRAERRPTMAMEAPDLDAREVFCFPMVIGAIKVGVLTAVRCSPGPLTPAQSDDALVLASALTARCLATGDPQSGAREPMDPLPTSQHAVVHQATGMVSVRLSLPLPPAVLRLRCVLTAVVADTDLIAHPSRSRPPPDPHRRRVRWDALQAENHRVRSLGESVDEGGQDGG